MAIRVRNKRFTRLLLGIYCIPNVLRFAPFLLRSINNTTFLSSLLLTGFHKIMSPLSVFISSYSIHIPEEEAKQNSEPCLKDCLFVCFVTHQELILSIALLEDIITHKAGCGKRNLFQMRETFCDHWVLLHHLRRLISKYQVILAVSSAPLLCD